MQLAETCRCAFNACLPAVSRLPLCLRPLQLLTHFWDLASLEEVGEGPPQLRTCNSLGLPPPAAAACRQQLLRTLHSPVLAGQARACGQGSCGGVGEEPEGV